MTYSLTYLQAGCVLCDGRQMVAVTEHGQAPIEITCPHCASAHGLIDYLENRKL